MEKVLSISIAAYNAENDISRCLDSLVACKSLDALDIIIVNDGSKDATKRIAESYVEKYPNSIRLVNKKNGGHGSTINSSMQLATGKYYKILDSDDWVSIDGLDQLVEFLRTNDVDMVLNQYEEISYQDHSRKKLIDPNIDKISYWKILPINKITKDTVLFMHSLTFSSSVIKQMGSVIDENCFYVDMEYCIFPVVYINSFVFLNFPVYEYLLGSASQSMNISNLITRRNQHLKVTKRIIDFYEKLPANINDNVRELIALRIKYAVYQQYNIYLHMKVSESKTEIIEFDQWLAKRPKDIYEGPKGKIMDYIKFNRFTGFHFYNTLTNIVKKLNLI